MLVISVSQHSRKATMNDGVLSRKAQTKAQFNNVADEYDAGPGCFAHFGERLVAAAGIQPGHRVLDVASGRGAVIFPCAARVGRTGAVIGVDLAEQMVLATNAEAMQRGLVGRVQVMDAEHLDFADASFDRVLCGFGIMFFPDQPRALGECRRVMKSGGRLAVSTWGISPTSEIRVAMAELGIPSARPPGWITESDELSKLLIAAGFTDVSVQEDSHSFRYADVDEYWQQARSTGMRRMLDGLSATDAERLRAALARRVGPTRFSSSATALIAVANR
jgi:ubiquinone/menaquinone biosynthesis C-methylase UbiE